MAKQDVQTTVRAVMSEVECQLSAHETGDFEAYTRSFERLIEVVLSHLEKKEKKEKQEKRTNKALGGEG